MQWCSVDRFHDFCVWVLPTTAPSAFSMFEVQVEEDDKVHLPSPSSNYFIGHRLGETHKETHIPERKGLSATDG